MKNKELLKAMENSKKNSFGIYDTEKKLSINPEGLAFFWDGKKHDATILEEVVLLRGLMVLKDIYLLKFGNASPYDLKLFEEDPAEFVERLIRAVEICSLNYVLKTGTGTLNTCPKANIIKGKRKFLWEH